MSATRDDWNMLALWAIFFMLVVIAIRLNKAIELLEQVTR